MSVDHPSVESPDPEAHETRKHFIRQIIDADNASGKWGGKVCTRFPPEPNGYLHIGHAKSICLNFGLAAEYRGTCNLRFDDTNPVKEEDEFVRSITENIRWLGFEGPVLFASDYFEQMYEYARQLIRSGKAYVDDSTADEIRMMRGTLTEPGTPSPYRDRTPEENLDLFDRMRKGEFPDGSKVLRARIDMISGNVNMRDPVMYRILHAHHHRTGGAWCVYPMYDWAHGIEDSIEGITHSICTLEFEDHRPLYDWFLDQLAIHHPQQIEFAKLALTYTLLSKRNLRRLVDEKHVTGWDDPRMPTLSGLRRRGYTPESIRRLCEDVGVSKMNSMIDLGRLEGAVRDHLNKVALRKMVVLRPLKVVIENYPEGQVEEMEVANNPEDAGAGVRKVPFCREIYIEREDFMEDPPRKFFRLAPGAEVRLRNAYWVKCVDVKEDGAGEVVELRCTYDPETRGGESPPDGRKVKGTLHWVSASHAIDAEVRLFDRLWKVENPSKVAEGGDVFDNLNPDSLEVVTGAKLEPSLADATAGDRFQFERQGYFCVDRDSAPGGKLVFNRTVSLKDSWAKVAGKGN